MMTMRRLLLRCGILSPLLYGLADAVSGRRWEDYSFRDQTISELGAIGAPSRPLFFVLLVPTYLLFTAFGIGVWHSAGGARRLRVAAGLLVGLGILALTVGLFVPMQPRGTEQGLTGALHLVEGAVAMIMLVIAMAFAGSALGSHFRRYTAATVALVVVFLGWSVAEAPAVGAGLATPWLGVKERIYWYGYQAWFGVLAVTLLRQTARDRHR